MAFFYILIGKRIKIKSFTNFSQDQSGVFRFEGRHYLPATNPANLLIKTKFNKTLNNDKWPMKKVGQYVSL